MNLTGYELGSGLLRGLLAALVGRLLGAFLRGCSLLSAAGPVSTHRACG